MASLCLLSPLPNAPPSPALYACIRCAVVEDSRIGMKAAKAAGMTCVITKSSYTEKENFDVADAIFDCIGEKGEERFSLGDLAKLVQKANNKVTA